MAVVVALQVFKDTGIGHECVSLVRNRNNQVQCLFPKPINFQAEKNSSCPTFETGLRGVVAPTARKERASGRSEEHTSELQSLMRISYAVFCLKTKKTYIHIQTN